MDRVWDAFYTVGLTSSPSLSSIPIFPKECQRDLYRYYEVDPEIIGQGSFACIRRVKLRREPSEEDSDTIYRRYYACKTIAKSKLYDRELFLREVYNLNRCQTIPQASTTGHNKTNNTNNNCVLRLLDVLEDRYSVHIVTELCEGGELFDYVVKEHDRTGNGLRGKALSPSSSHSGTIHNQDESRCATVVCQILTAFLVLHEDANVCHRDAKASNFVFCEKPSYVPGSLKLKLIDFGLSKFVGTLQEERDYRNSFVDSSSDNLHGKEMSCNSTVYSAKSKYVDGANSQVSSIWNVVKTVYDTRFQGPDALVANSITASTSITNEKDGTGDNFCEKEELYSIHCRYMTSEVGTPYYVAPEVLKQREQSTSNGYSTKCDIWSIGVLAFLTLTGSFPVMGVDEQETVQKLMDPTLEIDFSDESLWEQDETDSSTGTDDDWKKPRISNSARTFCQALLQRDPKKRPTAREALQFDWITNHYGESLSALAPLSSAPASDHKKKQYSRLPSLSTLVCEIGEGK